MLPVLTSAESRVFDDLLIKKTGLHPLVLIENAAHGALATIKDWLSEEPHKSILIFCGKGNNGADGFALARLLLEQGRDVIVIPASKSSEFSPETKKQFDILKKIIDAENIIPFPFKDDHFLSHLDIGIVVDALLGTGATGKFKKPYSEAVLTINGLKKVIGSHVLSLDVPTGLDADSGAVETTINNKPVCVFADRTVAMGSLKTGFFQGIAPDVTGELSVALLGSPMPNIASVSLIEASDIDELRPLRFKTASKFDQGHVLVIAGSRGMTGAAIMGASAALKSGCGLVTVATAASERSIVANVMPELMTVALPDNEGVPTFDGFAILQPYIERADVILLGPGIRNTPESDALMKEIFLKARKPIVCDAGALSMIAEDISILKKRPRELQTILTPHSGEFARMLGISRDELELDRIQFAREFAQKHFVYLIAKGAPTILVAPDDEEVYINTTGNPGMATAGSGDVLAGMCAGFIADEASISISRLIFAVYAHGLAGDIAAEEHSMMAITATDITRFLPKAFKKLGVE